jgi:hypothetical protein
MLKPKEVKVKSPILDGAVDLAIERIQYRLLTEFDWDDKYAPLVLAKVLPVKFLEVFDKRSNDGYTEIWAELTLSEQEKRLTLESMYLMRALDKAGLLEGVIEDYYKKHGHFRQQVPCETPIPMERG